MQAKESGSRREPSHAIHDQKAPKCTGNGSLEKELIAHLSNEIRDTSSYLSTFRSRIAFTVLIGPFVILGSFMAFGKYTPIGTASQGTVSIIILASACACYIALGYYGARLDKHATTQCNKWRRLIRRLSRSNDVTDEELVFEHSPVTAYMIGIILVLGGLLCIMYLLLQMHSMAQAQGASG